MFSYPFFESGGNTVEIFYGSMTDSTLSMYQLVSCLASDGKTAENQIVSGYISKFLDAFSGV